MIDSKTRRATAVMAAFLLVFCAAGLHAQTGAPGFRAIAFYTGKAHNAHISFVKEANRWFPKMAAERGFACESSDNWGNLNLDNLARYQVVIFLDSRPDAQAQRQAFRQYMEKSGGWTGFHFAGFALTP